MHRRAFVLSTLSVLATTEFRELSLSARSDSLQVSSNRRAQVTSATSTWLDLVRTPFSRRGCWLNLAIKQQPIGTGLYLRSNHASTVSEPREHFRIDLWRHGNVVPARLRASPAAVVATPGDGTGES
jgi:hypothetical protein